MMHSTQSCPISPPSVAALKVMSRYQIPRKGVRSVTCSYLQGQPTQGKSQHRGYQQRESLLPPLAPALLAVRRLPRDRIALQAHGDGTVGHAHRQQWDHIGGYKNKAGVQQSQVATVRPEFLTHNQVDTAGSQVQVACVERRRCSQGQR